MKEAKRKEQNDKGIKKRYIIQMQACSEYSGKEKIQLNLNKVLF